LLHQLKPRDGQGDVYLLSQIPAGRIVDDDVLQRALGDIVHQGSHASFVLNDDSASVFKSI
jgi:hypothetical protein